MPSFQEWLAASWGDFRRRWAVLLAVGGASGAAVLAACFLPFFLAALATLLRAGPAWAVWGAATVVAALAALGLSAWAQAAATRAALTEEGTGECLSRAWVGTAGFGWTASLTMLAVMGGFVLFVVPGLILTVMLFAAPFRQIAGEADGARALGLSWARVKPHFGAVALRILAAGAITAAPGWIPYVGWIVMMFWAPFGLVALARLDKDLRAAEPAAVPPAWTGAAVSGLVGVFAVATLAVSFVVARVVEAEVRDFDRPGGLASRVRPETAQALLESLSGQASDDQKKKAYADLLQELRGTP